MSKRAELRRTQREEKRANTATYNLTQAQLDAIVSEKIGKKIAETKKEIYEAKSFHPEKDRSEGRLHH